MKIRNAAKADPTIIASEVQVGQCFRRRSGNSFYMRVKAPNQGEEFKVTNNLFAVNLDSGHTTKLGRSVKVYRVDATVSIAS